MSQSGYRISSKYNKSIKLPAILVSKGHRSVFVKVFHNSSTAKNMPRQLAAMRDRTAYSALYKLPESVYRPRNSLLKFEESAHSAAPASWPKAYPNKWRMGKRTH